MAATSPTSKPARLAFCGSTRKLTVGPITTLRLTTSTTPFTLGSHSSISRATAVKTAGSSW